MKYFSQADLHELNLVLCLHFVIYICHMFLFLVKIWKMFRS